MVHPKSVIMVNFVMYISSRIKKKKYRPELDSHVMVVNRVTRLWQSQPLILSTSPHLQMFYNENKLLSKLDKKLFN